MGFGLGLGLGLGLELNPNLHDRLLVHDVLLLVILHDLGLRDHLLGLA